jgi:hypothetical protein
MFCLSKLNSLLFISTFSKYVLSVLMYAYTVPPLRRVYQSPECMFALSQTLAFTDEDKGILLDLEPSISSSPCNFCNVEERRA